MGTNNKTAIFFLIIVILVLFFSGCTTEQNNNISATFEPFSYPPADLEKVLFIIPLGTMKDEHVYPTDHQYYVASYYQHLDDENEIDVFCPGNGTITEIEYHTYQSGEILESDYRIIIQHTSKIFSYFIHIDNLTDKIKSYVLDLEPGFHEEIEPVVVNIAVEAGEKLGSYKGYLDYYVEDKDYVNNIINIESYESESWKIHVRDPFEYFSDEMQEKLIAKTMRTVEPIGGEIDYDIDGKLAGTWFLEEEDSYEYMEGERNGLVFAYDNYDPSNVVLSIGLYDNAPGQFGIKGNNIDPKNISIEDGLVKFELVNYNYYYDGEETEPDRLMNGLECRNEEQVQGILLVEMIEDQELKMEVFPGETSEEVTGFTDNFRIYTR